MGNMRGLYLIYLTIAFSLLNSALIADEVRPIALQSDLAKATEWLHSYKEKSLVSDVYLLRKSNFFDVFLTTKRSVTSMQSIGKYFHSQSRALSKCFLTRKIILSPKREVSGQIVLPP